MKAYPRIQYISNGHSYKEQEFNIKSALDAGITWVQLRWKQYPSTIQLFMLSEYCKRLCEEYKSIFIINDHVLIAKDLDTDGVHLGLKDTPVKKARQILGFDKIIGGTANSYEDLRQRCREQCNYIGLGPLRFTRTKQNLSPILGIKGYQKLLYNLRLRNKSFPPIYAIGGVDETDIELFLETGVYGVAVSSLIERNPQIINTLFTTYENKIKDC